VGVLDIDLCGPSIPRMLGVAGREVHQHDQVWIILFFTSYQCCRSGSILDPDSIRSVDPDPDLYSESGSGSRRAKMIQKSRIKISCFAVLDVLF
jgi:hypothetical protein